MFTTMRKMTFIACAAFLASACMFTACENDKVGDELQNANEQGNYNGEVVKTEFSIALPSQLGPNRMPGANVQVGGMEDFQGMTGITLLPFAKAGEIESSDDRVGDENITLADLTKSEVNSKTHQAKVYSDVAIPLTTSSFLFYAKSAVTGDKFNVGSLNALPANLDANPDAITFDLEPIMATPSATYTTASGALLTYLTAVANAEAGAPAVKWCDVESSADAGMAALFATYSTMHGLSTFEVSRVLTNIYRSLKPLQASNPLAAAVMTAIAAPTDVTMEGTNNDSVALADDLAGFPENCNLPVGAVDIKWVAGEKQFKAGNYSTTIALNKYVYPAQLWYYVNSTIKTSNKSQAAAYQTASNTWDYILGLHDAPTTVSSLTRAVAIKDQIQYAVARLDVGVKTAASPLKDNSDQVEAEATDVTVPAAGFPITGILIGGQKQVFFDFTTNTTGDELTIYDKNMSKTGMAAKTSAMPAEDYNHTLVLETAASTVVRIAVEMQNNTGKDFYGINNMLIPNGGKFYVVAQLDPATQVSSATGNKVFKQDYTTTATLTLTNLRNAYNTIPDLRTPKLELGFSVNLQWRTGDTYTVDFGS